MYGAMLCSGVFGLLIAKPFAKVIRFFPPLVAGIVITVIGLSLIGADVSLIAGDNPAAKDYGQVSHIALAGLVMLLIVVITRCFRGFVSQIAVAPLSIAIGTLAAWPMGPAGLLQHALLRLGRLQRVLPVWSPQSRRRPSSRCASSCW